MRYEVVASIASLLWLVSCGIREDKLIVELSEKEKENLCDENSSSIEEEEVMCDGEVLTVEASRRSDCLDALDEASTDCEATVGDWRQCTDDLLDDPCSMLSGDLSAACTTWASCLE